MHVCHCHSYVYYSTLSTTTTTNTNTNTSTNATPYIHQSVSGKCNNVNNNCGCDWDRGDCCGFNGNTDQYSSCVPMPNPTPISMQMPILKQMQMQMEQCMSQCQMVMQMQMQMTTYCVLLATDAPRALMEPAVWTPPTAPQQVRGVSVFVVALFCFVVFLFFLLFIRIHFGFELLRPSISFILNLRHCLLFWLFSTVPCNGSNSRRKYTALRALLWFCSNLDRHLH